MTQCRWNREIRPYCNLKVTHEHGVFHCACTIGAMGEEEVGASFKSTNSGPLVFSNHNENCDFIREVSKIIDKSINDHTGKSEVIDLCIDIVKQCSMLYEVFIFKTHNNNEENNK